MKLRTFAHPRRAQAMTTFFISHSSRADAWAEAVRAFLERQRFEAPFLDSHPEHSIPPGAAWERELYCWRSWSLRRSRPLRERLGRRCARTLTAPGGDRAVPRRTSDAREGSGLEARGLPDITPVPRHRDPVEVVIRVEQPDARP